MSEIPVPTTADVRAAIKTYLVHPAEFDAWLAEHDAATWKTGHDAGWTARHDDALAGWTPSGPHESDAVNPHLTPKEKS